MYSGFRLHCMQNGKTHAAYKMCFTAEQINKLGLDTIIVGSDEVWNYNDSKSVSPVKFGEGLTCKNLISYAPSAGNSSIENLPDFAKKE